MARDLKVVITGDAKGLSNAYRDADRATGKFGGGVKKMGLLAAGAVAGGTALLAKGLKDSVSAAMEAQKAQAALEAQMKASGQSYSKNASEINGVINRLSSLSGMDDEALSGAFTRLVRSTNDTKQALAQMTLTADIARAKNMDVAKAADVVGKVLDGNTGILKRYGVEVEKGATVQEALAAAQSAFAGQAEAYGKTTAGAQDRMRVAVENLQEAVGSRLLPVLTQMFNWAASQMPKIAAWFDQHGGTIRKVMDGISQFVQVVLVPKFQLMQQIASSAIAGVRKVFDENGPQIRNILNSIRAVVVVVSEVMTFLVRNVVIPIVKPMLETVLPAALKVAITFISGMIDVLRIQKDALMWIGEKGSAIFRKFKSGVEAVSGPILAALGPVAQIIKSIAYAMNAVIGIVDDFIRALDKIKGAAGGIAGAVGGAVSGLIPGKRAAGGPVSQGQAYVVGEKGPELFVPGANGTIIPNLSTPSSAPASGAASLVVNVYGSVTSERDLVETIRRELINVGRRNGSALGGLA